MCGGTHIAARRSVTVLADVLIRTTAAHTPSMFAFPESSNLAQNHISIPAQQFNAPPRLTENVVTSASIRINRLDPMCTRGTPFKEMHNPGPGSLMYGDTTGSSKDHRAMIWLASRDHFHMRMQYAHSWTHIAAKSQLLQIQPWTCNLEHSASNDWNHARTIPCPVARLRSS